MSDLTCALINSITLPCELSTGGIKEFKAKKLPSSTTISSDYVVTSGVCAIGTGSRSGWKTWSTVKETSSATDNQTKNIQNGATSYKPEIKFIVNKLRAQMRNEVEVLGMFPVQIAFRDMNDNYWLAGTERGLDLTTTNIGTGTALGDRSGYELTFTGAEAVPMYSISAATYATLIDA